ncbi:arylformamidase [Coemansia sp. RSA 1287]|nr:arylformamidase [Coemansia sp. RSA 1287]
MSRNFASTAPALAANTFARPQSAPMYSSTGLDVWTMMNQVAASVDAVNLGQGFMSFPPKDFIKRAAQEAFTEDANNQYAPPRGRPRLLEQLAARFAEKLGRPIDPGSEVSVHAGANEALLNGFFDSQRAEYERRRDRLMAIFDDVGLPYVVPDGAYYLLVNAAAIKIPDTYEFPDFIKERGPNFKLVYFFIKEFGVSGIPPTEFYSAEHKALANDYIRFAFCKTDEGLEDASKRLQKLKLYLQSSS